MNVYECHSVTLVPGHLDCWSVNISKDIFSETAWPVSVEFHIQFTWQWMNENLFKWTKSHDQDGCQGYKQKKKMNHFQNCCPICLETWYVALGD